MYALDLRRCPHCAAGLSSVPLADADQAGPLVLCPRCDDVPQSDGAAFVPLAWGDPLP